MRIVNSGGGPDTLESAESPWAARVELHDIVRDGDVVAMREQVNGVPVGPHSTLLLEPGHRHLMMQQVVLEPKARSLPLILHFLRAGSLEVTADIAPPRETFD
jgi:copper(I)-binding protein